MTEERVLEIRGFAQGSSEDIKLLPVETIEPLLNELDDWLVKYAGGVNYNSVRVDDFNFQPYVSIAFGPIGHKTEIYCAIENKVMTEKTLNSLVRLWPGPRGDYWTISAELSGIG